MAAETRCRGMALGLTTPASDRYTLAGDFLAGIVGCSEWESSANR